MDLDTPWHGVGRIMLISLEVQRTIERTDIWAILMALCQLCGPSDIFGKLRSGAIKKRAKWIASALGMKARISGCLSGTKWISAQMRGLNIRTQGWYGLRHIPLLRRRPK